MAEEIGQNVIDLAALQNGIPALTSALGSALAEAAAICLEHQGHDSVCSLRVRHEKKQSPYSLHRPAVSEPMRRAYRDLQEATELGACGIAILVARAVTGLVAVERSVKGTGFDYWLGTINAPESNLEPLERKARLEVSGILHDVEEVVEVRVRQKLEQTQRSAGTYPAYVVVVEFSHPMAWVERDE